MKAIVHHTYGSADVLELADIAGPRSPTTRCSCTCARPAVDGVSGTS